jgi:hypothetical protein
VRGSFLGPLGEDQRTRNGCDDIHALCVLESETLTSMITEVSGGIGEPAGTVVLDVGLVQVT